VSATQPGAIFSLSALGAFSLSRPVSSAFLPPTFDPRKPVALIAGQGLYPVLIAREIRRAGIPLKLVAFEEETRPDLYDSFPESDRRMLLVGQLGKMLKSLEQFSAGAAIMAGQITPRRLFKGLHPDLKATRILFSLKRRNAETIFGAIAAEIEKLGIQMLDARSFLDDQLATAGTMTGGKFPIEEDHVAHGIHIARECARLDIGQGVVVRKGTVLAVEAFEGTDEMLRRAGAFKTDKAVFVKTVKAHQDYRFDVPVFGQRTLETMREASLQAAALEAGRVIMLDKPTVISQAKAWGISLFGF
jgi:UDP-2,3-diacylglucosamine hydrolase